MDSLAVALLPTGVCMSNFKLGKVQYSYATTVTSNGTKTLSEVDELYQVFTGSSGHTLVLPDATQMAMGLTFFVINESTGIITIKDAGLNTIATVSATSVLEIFLSDNATSNGTWTTYASGASGSGGLWSADPGTTKLSAARALFAGGAGPSNVIDYVDYVSLGNAIDFGDLSVSRTTAGACASSTRGVFGGGSTGADSLVIDYVTFVTLGNATNFGNLTVARSNLSGCGSSTRGLFGGGFAGAVSNVIDYITIASTGNAIDFGDLTVAKNNLGSCSSPVRGIWGGGNGGSPTSAIDYVTIATLGNAASFGTLTVARDTLNGCSNAIHGLFMGGSTGGTNSQTVIDRIVIATLANAASFSSLSAGRRAAGCAASNVTAIAAGGVEVSTTVDTMDKVQISQFSATVDFGNLTVARAGSAGCSSAHGGLQW